MYKGDKQKKGIQHLTNIYQCAGCFCSICDWRALRRCWGASWHTRGGVVHTNSYPFIIVTGKQLCEIQLTHEGLCFAGRESEPCVHICSSPFHTHKSVASALLKKKKIGIFVPFSNVVMIPTPIFSRAKGQQSCFQRSSLDCRAEAEFLLICLPTTGLMFFHNSTSFLPLWQMQGCQRIGKVWPASDNYVF